MSVRCLGEKSGSICAALSGDPSTNDRCLKTFIAPRARYGFVRLRLSLHSYAPHSRASLSLYGRIKNNSVSLAGREGPRLPSRWFARWKRIFAQECSAEAPEWPKKVFNVFYLSCGGNFFIWRFITLIKNFWAYLDDLLKFNIVKYSVISINITDMLLFWWCFNVLY